MSYNQIYDYRTVQEGLFNAFLPLADEVFITSRPKVDGNSPKSYIVIRLSSGIRDQGDTYQTAKALIHIFVRDKEGGVEDAVLLDAVTNSICDLCPLILPRFTAWNPNFISSGEDMGFHYHIIQLSLTINKKTLPVIKVKPDLDKDFLLEK